jgi:ribosomal protein L16 Arg81 hydroxylase
MHKDNYDVYIIGLFGNTVYKIEDLYYEVEPGDLLKIPKDYKHKAISLTPRIILSYAVYET